MPVPVIIPKATISMEEASILKWLKGEGDVVSTDEPLFEMETDKAILEVPAAVSGVLLRILIPQGPVKVEQVVGWIGQPGEVIEAPTKVPEIEAPTKVPEGRPPAQAVPDEPRQLTAPASTPAARRRARELGIDLAKVVGTGPGGRVTEQDVEQQRETSPLPTVRPAHERLPLIQRLTTAWRSVPHIHIARLMDVRGLMEARAFAGPGISITDLMLFLMAKILPRFPHLTMTWRGDVVYPAERIGLAFAVDTDRGVVAPVIHDAGRLTLKEISQTRRALAEAARACRLRIQDLEGGVFTLTNLGAEGVDFFAPLMNLPQTAILAIGRAAAHPVVVEGALGVGWRMWANLAVDHRVTDGALAGRFLAQLQEHLHQLPQEVSESE